MDAAAASAYNLEAVDERGGDRRGGRDRGSADGRIRRDALTRARAFLG